MGIASLVVTIVLAAIVLFSGIRKLRNDPHIVKVIHETVGVPMKYFPALAACEVAGATGLVLGIWLPFLGIAAQYWTGNLLCGSRIASARRRCQGYWTCLYAFDDVGSSTLLKNPLA